MNKNLVDLKFSVLSLTKLSVPENNNSLLHAIANCYCSVYIMEKLNGISIDREQFIKRLREQLADNLAHLNISDPRVGANLENRDKMKIYLQSENPLTINYIPLLSIEFGYTIYIINTKTGNILQDYIYTNYLQANKDKGGEGTGQSAIILLYNPQTEHFDTGSLLDPQMRYWTVFPPTHELILAIKNEIELQK